MKKILVLTTAFLITISATFAKSDTQVPDQIVKKLNQEFQNSTNVEWKITSNYYKASFTADKIELEAFYSFEGKLIAVSRKLTIEQLPFALIKKVKDLKDEKEQQATFHVSELFELSTDQGTEYYITFDNGKVQKTYQSSGNSWFRYKAD